MSFLRDEITRNNADALSLAKWKVVTVAAICVAGLGWKDFKPDSQTGPLILMLVGYICVYVDIFLLRKMLGVHHVASFIRRTSTSPNELELDKAWEEHMYDLRKLGIGISERFAHLAASFFFSIGAIFLSVTVYGALTDLLLLAYGVPVFLLIVLWIVFSRSRQALIDDEEAAMQAKKDAQT